MDLSIFIARTLGITFLTVGLGFFIFREYYVLSIRTILDNTSYALFGGFTAIVIGMAMVTYHNLWVYDWRVIVTIVGWIALTKGILLLLMPGYFPLFKNLLKVTKGKGMTIFLLALGAMFTYLGFFY